MSTADAEDRLRQLWTRPVRPIPEEFRDFEEFFRWNTNYLELAWGLDREQAVSLLTNLYPCERAELVDAIHQCSERNSTVTGHPIRGGWIVGAEVAETGGLTFCAVDYLELLAEDTRTRP
jgi:hypothetical protein